jgi:hypothetical protein
MPRASPAVKEIPTDIKNEVHSRGSIAIAVRSMVGV